jgi:hypothetical protein
MMLAWATTVTARNASEAISKAKDEWDGFTDYTNWGSTEDRDWTADEKEPGVWTVSAWNRT